MTTTRKPAVKKAAAKKTTPAKKAPAKKAAKKLGPIIEVTHTFCGTSFAPHPAILSAINDSAYTGEGIDCPVCGAWRPTGEFTFVRGDA